MGLTQWTQKNTPHVSGVMILGIAAFCGPCFTVFGVECKALAQKPTITNVWLEFGGAFGLAAAAGFNGLFLWMNQSWGRHLKERDEARKTETELRALKPGETLGHDTEGHLR